LQYTRSTICGADAKPQGLRKRRVVGRHGLCGFSFRFFQVIIEKIYREVGEGKEKSNGDFQVKYAFFVFFGFAVFFITSANEKMNNTVKIAGEGEK
jgi:hypothetical protein